MRIARGNLKQADYVAAAVEFVDEHGLEAMTMRSLGAKMGIDATAVYRHFPTKEDLINAMAHWFFGQIVEGIGEPSSDPWTRIMEMAVATRRAFGEHPSVGVAAVNSTGNSSHGFALSRSVAASLLELGVDAQSVPVAYQSLEGYAFGACLMDYIGAPTNWEVRRFRYRSFEIPEFDAVSDDVGASSAVAETAYLTGIEALLRHYTGTAH